MQWDRSDCSKAYETELKNVTVFVMTGFTKWVFHVLFHFYTAHRSTSSASVTNTATPPGMLFTCWQPSETNAEMWACNIPAQSLKIAYRPIKNLAIKVLHLNRSRRTQQGAHISSVVSGWDEIRDVCTRGPLILNISLTINTAVIDVRLSQSGRKGERGKQRKKRGRWR